MFRTLFALLFPLLWLTGCATTRLVDTDVQSFATPPSAARGASYRFERLPSQQAQTQAAQQSELEALAEPALARVGLMRDDAAASYSVQIAAAIRVDPYAPWDRPLIGWGPGFGFGWGLHNGHGRFIGPHPFMGVYGFGLGEQPYYWRQVSLLMRDLSTAQVVYETHAAHDGRWTDDKAILGAMFEAALQGFPNPPAGPRRVNIEIPR